MKHKKVSIRQARTLSDKQQMIILAYFEKTLYPERNRVIFMLSAKLGLRACEMASLCWMHVLNNEKNGISDKIRITDDIAKGKASGREFHMGDEVIKALQDLWDTHEYEPPYYERVLLTQYKSPFSSNAITCVFHRWYKQMLLWEGYSSHSGRRTFITNCARKVSTVGGSLYDVQMMAGHKSLATTQIYIDENPDAQKRLVNMI